FRFAELPSALPAALSGARIAVAVGVIGADIAEISTAGTSSGLGHEIQLDLTAVTAHTPRAWAATVVLFLFAVCAFYLVGLAERLLAPWSTEERGPQR
ncbi:MAG: ABC transporter permease, partial [Solirubrobacteraceae bacterium]